MCPGRWQDRSATMFPGRCATACQERFATMFQGNSVPMFQDSSATTSLASSAETSHLKSATTFQEKFATMSLASSASKFPSRCVTLPSQPTAESRLRELKEKRNRSAESGRRITRGNKKRHLKLLSMLPGWSQQSYLFLLCNIYGILVKPRVLSRVNKNLKSKKK